MREREGGGEKERKKGIRRKGERGRLGREGGSLDP